MARSIDSIQQDTERIRQQIEFVQRIRYLIPCGTCTTHYQTLYSAQKDWNKWFTQHPRDGLRAWFGHVRHEIEKDMWNMRSQTLSKSILVHEYEERKATTKQLDSIYASGTYSADLENSIHIYVHFLLMSFDPESDAIRAKHIRSFVDGVLSIRHNDDIKQESNRGEWKENKSIWENRCTVLIAFYKWKTQGDDKWKTQGDDKWKTQGDVNLEWIRKHHETMVSSHASVKCKC
jgi:hypothetical protein